MPTTAKGFPYPEATAANNVPADLQALADMLELWPGIPSLTQAQIDALPSGAKTPNLHVYNSTTGRLQRWNGATWIAVNTQTRNAQGGAYTLALTDAGQIVEMSGGGTLTVPANASIAFPSDTQVTIIQTGAPQVTIAGAGGVTVNSAGGYLKIASQWSAVTLIKRATDTWVAIGALVS